MQTNKIFQEFKESSLNDFSQTEARLMVHNNRTVSNVAAARTVVRSAADVAVAS